MQIAVGEWLDAIPEFRVDTDATLIERGGGSMNSLLTLPLAWDRRLDADARSSRTSARRRRRG